MCNNIQANICNKLLKCLRNMRKKIFLGILILLKKYIVTGVYVIC